MLLRGLFVKIQPQAVILLVRFGTAARKVPAHIFCALRPGYLLDALPEPTHLRRIAAEDVGRIRLLFPRISFLHTPVQLGGILIRKARTAQRRGMLAEIGVDLLHAGVHGGQFVEFGLQLLHCLGIVTANHMVLHHCRFSFSN